MANPVGRPTGYNEDIQKKAEWYLMNYEQCEDVIPSRAGLCVYLGISKNSSYAWEKHPEFLHTLKAIEAVQEKKALNGGLLGDFNSTITKLVLANHGYSDKQQTDHTSSDGSMTPSKIERVVVDVDTSNTDS